jgi:hypothetical protein
VEERGCKFLPLYKATLLLVRFPKKYAKLLWKELRFLKKFGYTLALSDKHREDRKQAG